MTQEERPRHVLLFLVRVADDCCTDEGTRRRETYRDKEGKKK